MLISKLNQLYSRMMFVFEKLNLNSLITKVIFVYLIMYICIYDEISKHLTSNNRLLCSTEKYHVSKLTRTVIPL